MNDNSALHALGYEGIGEHSLTSDPYPPPSPEREAYSRWLDAAPARDGTKDADWYSVFNHEADAMDAWGDEMNRRLAGPEKEAGG